MLGCLSILCLYACGMYIVSKSPNFWPKCLQNVSIGPTSWRTYFRVTSVNSCDVEITFVWRQKNSEFRDEILWIIFDRSTSSLWLQDGNSDNFTTTAKGNYIRNRMLSTFNIKLHRFLFANIALLSWEILQKYVKLCLYILIFQIKTMVLFKVICLKHTSTKPMNWNFWTFFDFLFS
jgi:hypothetical protein